MPGHLGRLDASRPGAHRIKQEAREWIAEALGAEDVVLTTTIWHSEATAHAARERGQLVHELEEEARKGPSWWQIRRGEATGAGGAPRTAGGVAEDYHALAEEIVGRITAAEAAQAEHLEHLEQLDQVEQAGAVGA